MLPLNKVQNQLKKKKTNTGKRNCKEKQGNHDGNLCTTVSSGWASEGGVLISRALMTFYFLTWAMFTWCSLHYFSLRLLHGYALLCMHDMFCNLKKCIQVGQPWSACVNGSSSWTRLELAGARADPRLQRADNRGSAGPRGRPLRWTARLLWGPEAQEACTLRPQCPC